MYCTYAVHDNYNYEWKKDKSANNGSTLSLHIEAYETFVDGIKNEDLKEIKNAKHVDSISVIQNLFEFPRQQDNDQSNEPEVAGFRANQQLLNPNQMDDNELPSLSQQNSNESMDQSPMFQQYLRYSGGQTVGFF
uniref:Uncharacterized protein n=1 Tax=Panagrolaimus sp. PS1159 TaxID=55785 RepID=A0AC35FNA1_9BILA